MRRRPSVYHVPCWEVLHWVLDRCHYPRRICHFDDHPNQHHSVPIDHVKPAAHQAFALVGRGPSKRYTPSHMFSYSPNEHIGGNEDIEPYTIIALKHTHTWRAYFPAKVVRSADIAIEKASAAHNGVVADKPRIGRCALCTLAQTLNPSSDQAQCTSWPTNLHAETVGPGATYLSQTW